MVRWQELASGLLKIEAPLPEVSFPPEALPAPETRQRPYVVLHPFSSELTRQHALATWTAIVEALSDDYDIVLSAGPGDRERNPEFDALARRDDVSPDERGFLEKCALMRGAALVVSVDTSVMHLAVGAGAPTLCLASAAHVVDSIPYDPRITPENVMFAYHDMPCRGCLGACVHPLENARFPCVQRLDKDRVLAGVRAALKLPSGRSR